MVGATAGALSPSRPAIRTGFASAAVLVVVGIMSTTLGQEQSLGRLPLTNLLLLLPAALVNLREAETLEQIELSSGVDQDGAFDPPSVVVRAAGAVGWASAAFSLASQP